MRRRSAQRRSGKGVEEDVKAHVLLWVWGTNAAVAVAVTVAVAVAVTVAAAVSFCE